MTEEVLEKAIQAYADGDGYYLKLYAADLDNKMLDVLKDRYIARDKVFDDLLEKSKSIDDEKYDIMNFNIDNL